MEQSLQRQAANGRGNDVIYIKQEPNDLENNELYTEDDGFKYKLLESRKIEDSKCTDQTVIDSSLCRVGLDNKYSEQVAVKLESVWIKVGHDNEICDDKYDNDIKKEKTDSECVITVTGDRPHNRTANSEDLKSTEVKCRDGSGYSRKLRWFQCNFCDHKTKRKYLLLQHFRTRHDESGECYQYHCHLCVFTTRFKTNLQTHFKRKHDASPKRYQCHFCEYKVKIKYDLGEHIRTQHSQNIELHQCQYCEFKTKHRRALDSHLMCRHDDTCIFYQCEYCEFKTKHRNSLQRHCKTKHGRETER